ncbi:hypothetical protein TNCV_3513141 [Trichonephila clavipes]|nr:hypothetical protein TNCV_3513141 [Trichonephila clavipes]
MNCQTKLRINHLTAVKSVAILEKKTYGCKDERSLPTEAAGAKKRVNEEVRDRNQKNKLDGPSHVSLCEDYDPNAKETMRYAANVPKEHDFLTTAKEIRAFIGILPLAGYHSNTCERDFWSGAETLELPW